MRIVLAGGSHLALEFEQYIVDCKRAGRGLRDEVGREVSPREVTLEAVYFNGPGRLSDFQTGPKHIREAPEVWPDDVRLLIAIGDVVIRRRVFKELMAQGAKFASLIHPTAIAADNMRLGPGSILCPGAFVGPLANIGANVPVNTYASVGHDVEVGDHSIFSPYAAANGKVVLGEGCFLGSSAVITPLRKVGAFTKVSAGSVVARDIEEGCLAHGNPAKARRMFRLPDDYVPATTPQG